MSLNKWAQESTVLDPQDLRKPHVASQSWVQVSPRGGGEGEEEQGRGVESRGDGRQLPRGSLTELLLTAARRDCPRTP